MFCEKRGTQREPLFKMASILPSRETVDLNIRTVEAPRGGQRKTHRGNSNRKSSGPLSAETYDHVDSASAAGALRPSSRSISHIRFRTRGSPARRSPSTADRSASLLSSRRSARTQDWLCLPWMRQNKPIVLLCCCCFVKSSGQPITFKRDRNFICNPLAESHREQGWD